MYIRDRALEAVEKANKALDSIPSRTAKLSTTLGDTQEITDHGISVKSDLDIVNTQAHFDFKGADQHNGPIVPSGITQSEPDAGEKDAPQKNLVTIAAQSDREGPVDIRCIFCKRDVTKPCWFCMDCASTSHYPLSREQRGLTCAHQHHHLSAMSVIRLEVLIPRTARIARLTL